MSTDTTSSRNPFYETAEGMLRTAGVLLTPMRRSKREVWGATHDEIRRQLPGDELLPDARWTSTHAVSINAPPEAVWPWIVQIGQGRGGFYSYQTLENIFGCKMVNADTILPEFQNPQLGDEIRMHPSDSMPVFKIARLERPYVFLLSSAPSYDMRMESTVGVTWLFHLDPAPMDGTRLISRWRAYYEPEGIKSRVAFGAVLLEPLDFVMETKMLQGIQSRAEASVRHQDEQAQSLKPTWNYQMPLRP